MKWQETKILEFVCALGAALLGPAAAQTNEVVIHNFGGGGGYAPNDGVIRDSAGNLYGTTYVGGAGRVGVVYKVHASGRETVLKSFRHGAGGRNPLAGVIRDTAGNLYGTTSAGGVGGVGVVYKVDPTGHETVLHNFTGGADGGEPSAGVIRDAAGNLYGTTSSGGSADAGVVYKIDLTGHEIVLYDFTDGADGGEPLAGVIRDAAGNLYGTTEFGGPADAGVVYKLDLTNHETVLYNFTGGADGAYPSAVIRDAAGNLFGTANVFGKYGGGVLFELRQSPK